MVALTAQYIRDALQIPDFDGLAMQEDMLPEARDLFPRREDIPPQRAGVLVMLYPTNDDWQIVLTLRSDKLRGHRGQVSFPGGRQDPEDDDLTQTALRETCEELGICKKNLEILGTMTELYIPPSHYDVLPTVALAHQLPTFSPNPDEVSQVFTMSLSALLNPATRHNENWSFKGVRLNVPYYLVGGHKVWGATAMILCELENRLRAVLPENLLNPLT